MTRKKAIEAAIDAINGKRYVAIPAALGMAYDAGRIAGLREAARIAESGSQPCKEGLRPDTYAIWKALDIRKHARALANPKKPKKARGR